VNVGKSSSLKLTTDMEKIKKDLIKRKLELEAQLAQLNEDQSAPQDITGQDVGDQTISSIIENLRNSLQDTEFGEYKRVIKALEMIQDGTYGVCVDCECQIGEKRLKSYPDATRCVSCQELVEEGSAGGQG
jgi:DnaK suppressor protein